MLKLRDSLNEVRYGLESVLKMDGVNKELALSFENLLPDNVSLNSFTKEPTHTNLETFTVSLENRLKKIFDAMIELIKNIFNKVINWLRGNKDKDDYKEKKDDLAEKTDDSNKDLLLLTSKTPSEKEKDVNPKLLEYVNWSVLDNSLFFNMDRKVKDFLELNVFIESDLLDEAEEGLDNIMDMLKNDYIVAGMFEGVKNITETALKRNKTFSGVLKQRYSKAGYSENVFHLDVLSKEMKRVISEANDTPSKELTVLDLLEKYNVSNSIIDTELEERLLSHVNGSFTTRFEDLEKRFITIFNFKRSLENKAKFKEGVYSLYLDSALNDVNRILTSLTTYLTTKAIITNVYYSDLSRIVDFYSLLDE